MNIEFLDELYRIKHQCIQEIKYHNLSKNTPVPNDKLGHIEIGRREVMGDLLEKTLENHNQLIKKYIELK